MIVLARRRFAFVVNASLVATAMVVAACGQGSSDREGQTTNAETLLSTITTGAVTAQLVLVNDWDAGYQASVRMQNTGEPTTSWETKIMMNGSTMASSWNAVVTPGSTVTAANEPWNAAIPSASPANEVWGFVGAGATRPALLSLTVAPGASAVADAAAGGNATDAVAPSAPAQPPPAPAPGAPSAPAPADVVAAAPPSGTGSTCDNFGSIFSTGNTYFLMNNVFNDVAGSQCISLNGPGFTVTRANHNIPTNGAPASYVAFVRGCHFGTCTTGGNLPKQVSAIASVPSSFSVNPAGSAWDAAYDIWFDPTQNTTSRNTGLEMMIWLNSAGVQPIGAPLTGSGATVTLGGATYQIWYSGSASPPVITYRRQPTGTTTGNIDIKAFIADAMGRNRGTGALGANGNAVVNAAWFMTSVQAGFELWNGGTNASVTSFSAAVN